MHLKPHLEGTRAKDMNVLGEWKQWGKYISVSFFSLYTPVSD
jgi:hypothetical protein